MSHPLKTLPDLVQIGEPHVHRGVTVCPLYPRRRPEHLYVTLGEALERGLRVTEVSDQGAVPQLRAVNPLGTSVLLYDGEELAGAKQNRILDVTVLVPAKSELTIPVSCVERGRWRYRQPTFEAASHAASPALRRTKAARLRTEARPGAAQGAVWAFIQADHARLETHSPTEAYAAAFEERRPQLEELRDAFPLEPGQSGALVAVGPDALCLDWLSRPEAFAPLYPKLLDGYLLDGIGRPEHDPADRARLEVFLDALARAEVTVRPSPGLGSDLRLTADGFLGTGLELAGELIQLSAYTLDTTRQDMA